MKSRVYTSIDNQIYFNIWETVSSKCMHRTCHDLVIYDVVWRRVAMYMWHSIDKPFLILQTEDKA